MVDISFLELQLARVIGWEFEHVTRGANAGDRTHDRCTGTAHLAPSRAAGSSAMSHISDAPLLDRKNDGFGTRQPWLYRVPGAHLWLVGFVE